MQDQIRKIMFSFAILCLSSIASAEVPIDAGRFMINLPDEYHMAPQDNELVYKFNGDGPTIIIIAYLENEDLSSVFSGFNEATNSLQDRKVIGDLMQLNVNEHKAIFGIYKGVADNDGKKVELYNAVGTVVLEGMGSLGFFSVYPEVQKAKWEPEIINTFHSIRTVNDKLSGPSDQKKYSP